MRKYFLIIAIFGIALQGTLDGLYAQYHQSDYKRLSGPMPFDEIANQQPANKSVAAVSTGYMFMDNQAGITHPIYQWQPTNYEATYPNIIYSQDGYGALMSTEFESNLWHRIYPGYYSTPISEREWQKSPTEIELPLNSLGVPTMPREGLRYFRNPAQRFQYTAEYSTVAIDSNKRSFAGPIPIGFAFYMNGLRYDSFYVSTCGIIALSNRRYFYDGAGRRAIPAGETDCYDPNSADWPFRMSVPGSAYIGIADNSPDIELLGRYQSGRGSEASLQDAFADDYGFVNIACGGDPNNADLGIRSYMTNGPDMNGQPPAENPSIMMRLNNPKVSGGAYITPFEGPFYMPQTHNGVSDDRGKVWYKRNAAGNNLIIYFENFHMMAGTYEHTGITANAIQYKVVEGRVGQTQGIDNVLEGSVQVELNGLDNSITFRYGDWRPVGSNYTMFGETKQYPYVQEFPTPWNFFQPFASVAVGGYARHRGYDTKTNTYDPAVNAENPWAGQYAQWTQSFNGHEGTRVNQSSWIQGLFASAYSIKFKQWRNALRLVDVQYQMKEIAANSSAFTNNLNTAAANNFENPIELLAGHEQLGQLRPVVLVQNLTNDVQGPEGVNFVEQDFQFQAHVRIANKVTEKIIYNRVAKIADTCLYTFDDDANGFQSGPQKTAYCGAEQVSWVSVTKDAAGNYVPVLKPHDDYMGFNPNTVKHNGISPYNFVQVTFPTFVPNRNLADQLGLMELTTFTDATHPISGARIGDEWTLDDTARTAFWVISNVPDFRSNGEFHYQSQMGYLPDVSKWVHNSLGAGNIAVAVVPGGIADQYSHNPLPPLGRIASLNDPMISIDNPMYQFSAFDWSKLTSFPVDLRNNTRSMVSLAVQKGSHDLDKSRGFSDNTIVGPEARVFFDINSRASRYMYDGSDLAHSGRATGFGATNQNGSQTSEPYIDFLFVEYLSPSPDNVKNIISTGVQQDGSNINDNTYKWDANQATSPQINNRLWRGHRAFNTATLSFEGIEYLHSPALAVFGGGGYYLGWTFANGKTFCPATWNNGLTGIHDQAAAAAIVTLNKYNLSGDYKNMIAQLALGLTAEDTIVAGLMPNPYDAGFDDQFHRYSVIIPDYYIIQTTQTSDPGANFRFRIRTVDVASKITGQNPLGAGKNTQNNPSDDRDIFLVDNVAIVKPIYSPDIELQSVNIPWPYLSAPITQATGLQVVSRLTNMGNADASPFNVKVRVYRGQLETPINVESAIYCQSIGIPSLPKGETIEVTASNLSLGEFATSVYPGGSNIFTLQTIVNTNRLDPYPLNDTIYSYFTLTVDTVMKYVSSTTNAVPNEAGLPGKGLNLGAHSIGGYMVSQAGPAWVPTRNGNFRLASNDVPHGGLYMNFWDNGLPRISYVCGGNLDGIYPGNDHEFISGQIAVKFEIHQADSLRGVMAQFGGANQAFDDISFNVYADNNGLPGGQVAVANAELPLLARRLYAKAANGTERFVGPDAPILYEFARPVLLAPGTYWVSIDQRGETGLELAATGESMGMRTMIIRASNDGTINAPLGNEGMQLMLERRLRVATDDPDFGRVYANNNIFAYRNIMRNDDNGWQQFMPTVGQIAYPHLNHFGMLSPARNHYQTFTRGTWAPLVVPYFGNRTIAANNNTAICPDEAGDDNDGQMAINITSFVGVSRQAGIELFWEAISANDNNSHFIIERQEADEVNTWTEVERVLGSVEKSTAKSHSLLDDNVTAGKTYRYRLYQMYDDGSLTCQNSHTVTVAYNPEFAIDLAQNNPNPFNSQTNIDVTVPTEEYVTLEIIDIFGNVVKTLASNELLHGTKRYVWNGDSNAGMQVSDGHYIYRLTAGTETITKKLTLLRAK